MPIVAAAVVPAMPELAVAEPGPTGGRPASPGSSTSEAQATPPTHGDAPRVPTGETASAGLPALVRDILRRLPPVDVVVLLAAGDEPLVHDVPVAVATPQGSPPVRTPIGVDERLLRAIARRGQAPRTQSSELVGDLGTLAVLAATQPWETPAFVPVTVAARSEVTTLDATAVGLIGAVAATGQDVAVIVAGDLARPEADVDDAPARAWDDRAAAAVAAGDAETFRSLGPLEAAEVAATGWAPLSVLLGLAAQVPLRIATSTYHLDGTAGRLAALLEPDR